MNKLNLQPRNNFKKSRGLSLLELLVVMIIVAMVTTMMMQGFSYLLLQYQYLNRQQLKVNQQILANNWFEQVNKHLVPDKNEGQALQGSAKKLSSKSFNPLISPSGVPTAISWELKTLQGKVILYYTEQLASDEAITVAVAEWQTSQADFSYMDEQLQWHDNWPLTTQDIYLPKAIRLLVKTAEADYQQLIYRQTRPSPEVMPDEILFGR